MLRIQWVARHLRAARKGHAGCVQLLVETYNVKLNTIDNQGRTPVDEAEMKKHVVVATYLKSKGGRGPSDDTNIRKIRRCAKNYFRDFWRIQKILRSGIQQVPNLDALRDRDGNTLFGFVLFYKSHAGFVRNSFTSRMHRNILNDSGRYSMDIANSTNHGGIN